MPQARRFALCSRDAVPRGKGRAMKIGHGNGFVAGKGPACLAVVSLLLADAAGSEPQGYRKPPKEILDILDAPPTPLVSVSPTRDRLVLVQGVRYPPVADLAQPMLRLAGLRINPQTNGPHSAPRHVGLTLLALT